MSTGAVVMVVLLSVFVVIMAVLMTQFWRHSRMPWEEEPSEAPEKANLMVEDEEDEEDEEGSVSEHFVDDEDEHEGRPTLHPALAPSDSDHSDGVDSEGDMHTPPEIAPDSPNTLKLEWDSTACDSTACD
eukprot:TRINITY_DN2019_c1_g2_i3.p2 TRINITY_DN2019_c1_g2~~TRINITY_DN2019_c1_g2_i3.p2  ORF type:complete len:130 (+),score=53.90 TRINITY_DN2019_c1_g2_i3:345-734(+)